MARIAVVLLAMGTSASAQWLNFPTPGLPRNADGRPNLAAPAPRAADGKPDLSGLWMLNAGPGHIANIAADLKAGEVQPWADELYKERLGNLGRDDPWTAQCLPAGPRETSFSPRLLGTYEFVKDAQGMFTRMIAYSTEGDVVAVGK